MKYLIPLILLFTFASEVDACPAEIDRTPAKYKASAYEVKLLKAIYHHENSQREGYCMAVLSPKYKGCKNQVRQALKIIRQEWKRWDRRGREGSFIKNLGLRYCPLYYDKVGHYSWVKNIKILMKKNIDKKNKK